MCSRMEEGLSFSELREKKQPSLCPFPQDSSLLHKGPYAVIRNLILIGFDFYCGPVHWAVTHDWPTFHPSAYLCLSTSKLEWVWIYSDFHGERGNNFRTRKNVRWNPIAVCVAMQGQDRREILVWSTDWRTASVIIFHSVIKPGDNVRVVKLEWHFALSHWVQQLSCI